MTAWPELDLHALQAKFPGWEVTFWETSVGVVMWSAFWRSVDGRSRIYRVAESADGLAVKLADHAWPADPAASRRRRT